MSIRATVFAAALLASGTATPAAAQLRGVRFEVTAVSDTTVTFRAGTTRWVKDGDRGIAVDPRRHDALVARLRVVHLDKGSAIAIVTGQTTALSTEHIVVMEEPTHPWFRSRSFWSGLLAGAALGAVVGYQH
ncbi:MAG: hypothetical protein ABIT38_19895 [Gemmatimonadaceae bacterium]